MFVKKVTKKWRKCEYVPYGVEGSVLFVGQGENTVSIDLEAEQADRAKSIRIAQDYNGTLVFENSKYRTALVLDIPPERTRLVETGELNEKDEPIKIVEKIPVDVDNCSITLFPLEFPLEKEDAGHTNNNTVM